MKMFIHFDKDLLLKNKRNIEYLYGQLYSVHAVTHSTADQSIESFSKTYLGNNWTREQAIDIRIVATSEWPINIPFSKERNDTTRISRHITPTLSPKDPAFPAWWEAHRGEWRTEARPQTGSRRGPLLRRGVGAATCRPGDSAMMIAGPLHPPISLLPCQKRNGPYPQGVCRIRKAAEPPTAARLRGPKRKNALPRSGAVALRADGGLPSRCRQNLRSSAGSRRTAHFPRP